MDQKFSEFSELIESDKSMKHDLGSIAPVLLRDMVASYTRDSSFEPLYCYDKYFYRPQRSLGKVIFSQASVILSTGGGGVCVARGGHEWLWGMCVWGVWGGGVVCMVGGHACVAGGCAWPGGVRGWGCMAGGMCGRGHA